MERFYPVALADYMPPAFQNYMPQYAWQLPDFHDNVLNALYASPSGTLAAIVTDIEVLMESLASAPAGSTGSGIGRNRNVNAYAARALVELRKGGQYASLLPMVRTLVGMAGPSDLKATANSLAMRLCALQPGKGRMGGMD